MMNIIKILTFVLLIVPFFSSHSQGKVCESKLQDSFSGLNTISKCAIEDFKKSNSKEYVQITTRNRYVRKRGVSSEVNVKARIKAVSSAINNSSNANTLKSRSELKRFSSVSKREVAKTTYISEVKEVVVVEDFIRFDKVSEIPFFITCNGSTSSDNQECVKETFVNNILDNLIYPFDAASEGIEGTVWVRFIINKEGYVENVSAKGPLNAGLLEKEAKRLINLLPKFVPGKQNNDYVNVEYFLPIDFQLIN